MIESLKLFGLFGFLTLKKDKIFTVLFYHQANIVRLPVYILDKKGVQGIEILTS